jgi:hypothetical protein
MRKSSKCQKYITVVSKTEEKKKDASSFPKRRLQVHQKMVGILKN